MKKILVFIGLLFIANVSADTIVKTSRFKNIKDSDTIHTWWWKDPIDSIVKTTNGRLSNVNIKSGANISYTKMDSTGTIKARRGKFDTLVVDTLRSTKRISVDTLTTKKITSTQAIVGDSIAVRAISQKDTNGLILHKPRIKGQTIYDSLMARNTIKMNLCDSAGVLNHWASVIVTDSIKSRHARIQSLFIDTIHNFKADTITADNIIMRQPNGTFLLGYPTDQFDGYRFDTVKYIVYYNTYTHDTIVELFFKNKVYDTSKGASFLSDSLLPSIVRPNGTARLFSIEVFDSAFICPGTVIINSAGTVSFLSWKHSGGIAGTPDSYSGGNFVTTKLKGHMPFSIRYRK
jgi:hypothetical protein